MILSHKQIVDLSKCMKELSLNADKQEKTTDKSIRGTNRVITFFTLVGAFLAVLIFVLFVKLTSAVNSSIVGMKKIDQQVADLSKSINGIASSSQAMTKSIAVVADINIDVQHISMQTGTLGKYLETINANTKQISLDSGYVRYHTAVINQHFSAINGSMGSISYSLHESAKPISQFIPIP